MNGTQAVTYYVSKAGNNTNGRSWATAWSDTTTALDSVESHMGGGDTCFFGAGTWIGRITPNGSGTINDRTCYADSGISLSPIEYTGLSHITGAEAVTNWTVYSGNVYKSYLAYTPIPDYPTMYCASDNDSLLAYVGSIAAVDAAGEYFHDASTDSVYVYCYDGGNPNTHTILIANNYSVVDLKAGNDYVTFIGLEISYGNSVVMRIADLSTNNPDYITVSHCVVHHVNNDGTAQNPALISTRGTPGSDSSTFSHGDTIRACTLYATRNGANWYGHNNGIVFYEAIACVVESCYVYGGGSLGAGIHVKGNNIGGAQPNNVIRYNTVENAGTGICLTSLPIRDSIYGNIIKNGGKSDAWGISIEGLTEDSACRVFNNTIYNIGKPFVLAASGYDGLEGTGDSRHFLKYNITHFGGTEYGIFWGSEDITDTNNFLFDSNYYYQDGRNIQIQRIGAFANWQAAGQDVHSIVTNPGLNSSFEPTNIPRWDIPITYGGRTWYGPGAVQTLWEPDPDCDPPGATTLTSPANGATGLTQPLTFDWQDVATATLYQIQIDDNVAFNSPEIDAFATASSFNTSGLTAGATYHWRIKAYNACGGGNWSVSRNFTTYCEQIGAPDIALPVDGADNQTQPVNLDWNSVTGADQYHVQVDDNPDFSSPERDQQTTASNYSVSGLADGTTYYWKVCAHNACGWGNWSTTSSFTTFSFATQTFDIYDLEVLNITDTSALIEWKTTEEATSRVEYGTTAGYGLSSPLSTGLQMVHSILLTQLNQDTDYHFRVVCTNADDELSISPDSSFHTRSTISGNGSTLTGSSNTAYGALEPTLRVNNYDNNDDNVYYFEVAEDSSFALLVESSPAVLQEDGEVTSWQVTEELNIGQTYYWRANVNNLVYSPVYTFVIHPKTYAMPNPYRPDSDPPATFANVPSGSNLVIMSVSGNEVIKRWTNHSGGDILWDGTNQAGNHVASQTYLWFVENTNIKGKIIVIR